MKCPHRSESFSVFSREMSKSSKERRCPHCGAAVKMAINFKVALLAFIPAVVFGVVLVQCIGKPSLVVANVALGLLTTRLEPAQLFTQAGTAPGSLASVRSW